MSTATEWVDVTSEDNLFEGASIAVIVHDQELALHCIDGVPYASDNLCTHGAARLCEGFIEGHEIECPLHQGRFDLRNGKAMGPPATEPIRVYPARLKDGRVWVEITPG